MTDYFPFRRLGFRCNPFRRPTAEEWASLAVLPGGLLEAVRGGGHVQVIGDAGTGKSTCLRGLAARFAGEGRRAGYECLAAGQRRPATRVGGLEVLLLDEAQRLTRRERSGLLEGLAAGRGRPRMVLGVHEDLTPLFARYGQPLLTVRLGRCPPSHAVAVLSRRLSYFALDDPPATAFSAEAAGYLCAALDGNLRRIDDFLYEFFQALPRPGLVTAAMLAEFNSLGSPPVSERPRPARFA